MQRARFTCANEEGPLAKRSSVPRGPCLGWFGNETQRRRRSQRIAAISPRKFRKYSVGAPPPPELPEEELLLDDELEDEELLEELEEEELLELLLDDDEELELDEELLTVTEALALWVEPAELVTMT